MAPTPLDIARQVRPGLTRLFLLYFRKSVASHISTAQLSIMMILEENGPMRISQIATAESIRMPTASNAVNQLESMGLVMRTRDVSDRRGVRVALTPRGHSELDAIAKDRAEQLAAMLEGLTPEELEKAQELVPMINLILARYSDSVDLYVD